MTPEAAARIFWAMRQEARCHEALIGLKPDDLRILFHWPPLVAVGTSWLIRN